MPPPAMIGPLSMIPPVVAVPLSVPPTVDVPKFSAAATMAAAPVASIETGPLNSLPVFVRVIF